MASAYETIEAPGKKPSPFPMAKGKKIPPSKKAKALKGKLGKLAEKWMKK
jgi:hypothetical protein